MRGTRLLRICGVLLCVAARCAVLRGADPAPARIRVPVWLDNAASAPRPSDFRATAGGLPAKLLALESPGDDLLLIMALDMTQDLTQCTLAKDALAAEIRSLAPRTVVTILRAQDSLKVLAPPNADRSKAAAAVKSLKISGKAGLLDTVEFLGRTGDAILSKSAVRVAVLYVTDSDIQNYRENFTNPSVNSSDTRDLSRKFPEALIQERVEKLSTRLSRQQTPLFIVHLVYRNDRMNLAYQSGLQQLAEITAGTSAFCRSSAEVAGAIRKAFQTIESHYSMTLALPPEAPRSVQLQITSNGANTGRVVAHRAQVSAGN